ncbi:MAG: oxidoreductase [Crocinitomicaceae bacterium]|nr:oxidoreductase [Crocinitomicaceae bacterium]|tara:strand:+ start:2937 stop:3929 length:993 start_codon:yes stop_codon:yes gene_type:complete
MLKVGVLGAGHLGKIHLRLLKELTEEYELVGFFDPHEETAKKTAEEYGLTIFSSKEALIDAVDVVDIVTPTLSHFECAEMALRKQKHVFIEKPITNTIDEAKKLIIYSHEANVKVQVGHVERFNPAFMAAKDAIDNPMFIETHRLAQFNPRGTDVSVVLDLMIHDLDIVLSTVNSNIKKISASGVAVVSDTPDICNARLEFDNGCVANLTASRISLKNMRKTRIFQRYAYISMDFLDKEVEIVRMHEVDGTPDPLAMTFDPGNGKPLKEINFNQPKVPEVNAIKEELRTFAHAINTNTTPLVTIDDGYNALEVAYKIIEKLSLSPNLMEQ